MLQGLPERFNFAQHVLAQNAGRAAKVAYEDDAGRLTYGQLAERVRRLAAALGALGLRREERVLVLMQDTNDWPVVFLGALYAGVVPVAVNTLLSATDYAFMLEHSRARAAFVGAPLLATLQAALGEARHEVGAVVVARDEAPAAAIDLEELLARTEPLAAPADTG